GYEIKHDGYRLMARRDPIGIRLLTRNGHDWAPRYPLIVEAVNRLKAHSCLIDGEAVCCDENGLAVFALLRYRERPAAIFLYAFDLLEFDGQDLRRSRSRPARRRWRACCAAACQGYGLEAWRRCRLPPRLQARLRGHRVEAPRLAVVSGRTRHWLKFKNPAAPAVKREAEEEWGKR